MKKIMLSAITALLCAMGYAQDLPKIIPPSPEASSLGKFIEIPVSHFTGLPNISVPIYTINEKEVSIPINLSYHARGIQVEEIASRVGLGWTLSYGGSLSRQVRGGADDGPYGFSGSRFQTFGTDKDKRRAVQSAVVAPNDVDFLPDQYSFNANGQSGKFVMNYMDGAPLVQKYGDLIVEKRGTGVAEGFIITDKKGIKYYFGTSKDGTRRIRNLSQTLHVKNVSNNGVQDVIDHERFEYFNSWMLTDIVTPTGGHVEFLYERLGVNIWKRSYDKVVRSEPYSNVTQVYNDEYIIKEIRFNQGKVIFGATTERQDLSGSRTLDYVEIKDNAGKRIKKYNLEYTYTTAPTSTNQLFFLELADPKANKRLFLSKVTEEGAFNELLPPYTFEYSNQILPSRFSNSQDYWGYYNGANNGRYLTFSNYANFNINRTVDTLRSEAGMLKKITFPTGGSRKFTYEHNKGRADGTIKDAITNTINPLESKFVDLSPKDHVEHYDGSVYAKDFVIGPNVNGGTMKVSFSFPAQPGCTTGMELATCLFQVSIAGSNIPHGEMMLTYDNTLINSLTPGNYTLKVRPINHIHNPFDRGNNDFYVRLNWNEVITSEYIYAAGKRIKRIENLTATNSLANFKEYSYKGYDLNWNENLPTSGVIFALPNFYTLNKVLHENLGIKVLKAYGSVGGSPFSTYQGNSIGYQYVTEYYGDKQNNIGKTIYKFTMDSDAGGFMDFPYHIPRDNDWLRGLNLYTRVYKNNGTGYDLLKEVKNEYTYGKNSTAHYYTGSISRDDMPYPERINDLVTNVSANSRYIKDRRFFQLPLYTFIGVDGEVIDGISDPNLLGYKVYHLTGGTVDLAQTEEKSYFEDGIETNVTKYSYNYDKHYQLASSEITDSNSDVIKTKNFYPRDVENTTSLGHDALTTPEKSAIDKLKSTNNVGSPVQVESYFNNILLATQRTNYKDLVNGVLPGIIQTSKNSLGLEDRVVYHSYDGKGNPTEVSKKEGTHIVYIWGYQQSYPIAKIENATLSEISLGTIIDLQNKSNIDTNSTTEASLRTALNNLRSSPALAEAQITTFTYDPLIGVTSITDPRGQTMYYAYDSFNRLEFIKDKDGKILKEHKYKYKN